MAKQSVRIQLKDGGEVEVASVADAEKHYPDAKVVQVTTFDKDGIATTEPYRTRSRATTRADDPAATKSDAKSDAKSDQPAEATAI